MNTETYLEEFVETFLPINFQWRKGQKEAILEIIDAYDNGTKTIILDAVVGSGKSLIGLAVSYILNKKNKSGYILSSEITLQEQYENDFKRFHLNWGSVKGISNYSCIDNYENNSLGTCRIRNKVPKKMYCYRNCPYFSARDHAARTQTSLLNYAYWLIMQNYVNQDNDTQLFPPRDFVIADEAHKILDIVQNHYSPRFDNKVIEKLEKLTKFFETYKIKDHHIHFQSLKTNIKILFEIENQDKIFDILSKIEIDLEAYRPSWDLLKNKVKKEYPEDDPPREWRETLRLCDWLKDFHCKIEDYIDIIERTSKRNIVKNPMGEDELVMNCLQEAYLMHKYFHQWTGFTLLMSATFADPSNYLRSIALKEAKYIKMSSNFDFSKSPIYFYNKRRMSYNQIEANLPWLYKTIDEILDKHLEDNGIIHSASYHLAMKIHNNLSEKNKRRILVYEGTSEKKKVLEILKRDKNKILLGPSLIEGLDLKDDWSRFIIFAKIPYLSLADRFVKTKLEINPEWYQWRACVNVLQGAGRAIRNENDWAITYILDGSLSDLIHKNRKSFPPEFMQRIKVVT